ncbi:hypothetical protein MUO14_10880 [Halobacillus shinanisalinarum]|uniref:Uncharacterized protein n=1 Tax=Halobacillus shinanisalinarum TaxID=2932258 RepID=A0ABY4H5K6_9BACI|nr:hypothetical protein [Halobacillus shinanisalinarum]UOQ95385.1 hypothetical protein MUO14_10880 [Halobacillus shinanisalinarum]
MSNTKKSVERGQSITFRVPSDTPDHLLKQLTDLKEKERRNFSSKIAQYVMDGVSASISKEKETVTIPLPRKLTKEQRSWMKHEHSEALMGSIIYQLMIDPTRAMTLLASLNSNSVDINEALYLQEEAAATTSNVEAKVPKATDVIEETEMEFDDSALDDLSLDNLHGELHQDQGEKEATEEEDDDLLGDFLSSMNK